MKRLFALALLLPVVLLSSGAAPLRAAEPDPELTGSAVTVTGRKDLQYPDDWSNLRITVAQTKNLVNQGVQITWTGGTPTGPNSRQVGRDFLQMMQCWGPDPDAANFRETCMFGNTNFKYDDVGMGINSTRREIRGSSRDPKETLPATARIVPFRTATGETVPDDGTLDQLNEHFRPETTNEVPFARTAADGTGRFTFEMHNSTLSPALGCGALVGGTPRKCWLVIVPRGAYDARGAKVGNVSSRPMNATPLGPTPFANRIVVPLEFQPVGQFCPLGGKDERQTVGSELVGEVIQSWQPALCQNSGPVFGFSPAGDQEAGLFIQDTSFGGPGLAFVTQPVVPAADATIVHAPVALSAAVIGIKIDTKVDPGVVNPLEGREILDIKLTPRLLAKLLTQSYYTDVPDGANADHVKDNPPSIRRDKEFLDLNPAFALTALQFKPEGLMVVGGNSAVAKQVWEYILADDEARSWLAGKPDDQGPGRPGMKVNKYYKDIIDGPVAPEMFPKLDESKAKPVDGNEDTPEWGVLDSRPYQGSLQAAARQTLRADSQAKNRWDNTLVPPAYATQPAQLVGSRFALSITESASAERWGLAVASLRNRAGEFVKPSALGLLRGVDAMDPTDTEGVVRTNPKKKVKGAYPLSMVTYAAVNLGQDQAARDDDVTLLRYAAGAGQESGIQRGELPPGYEPLPASMRRQTLAVADKVKAGIPVSPEPEPEEETGEDDPVGGDVGDVGNPATPPDAGSRPVPDAGAGPAPSSAPVLQRAGSTMGSDAGMLGDLLPALLILGALCAVAGPVLLRLSRRRGA